MPQLIQLPDDVDLSFMAGDTFRIRIRVIDPSDSSALPLADYQFHAEIARDTDHTVVGGFKVDPDTLNPDTAVILTLPPTETAALISVGGGDFKGMWDLQVTFPSPDGGTTPGDVRTVAKGAVLCYVDITQPPYPYET
jgi:hypothetical protein